ncbi:hypothetical protein DPM19_21655 [Actinomadura craniellae]|uniref:Uncharacterized protein n=1 Tax=Actinomadura craniellae TaxID=2231787 RepID=A0A365H285_9ACTN|nr:hypothetical protein DPM19_21655 [Actinomadura craniellae]
MALIDLLDDHEERHVYVVEHPRGPGYWILPGQPAFPGQPRGYRVPRPWEDRVPPGVPFPARPTQQAPSASPSD